MKSRNVVIVLLLLALVALAIWWFGVRHHPHTVSKASEAHTVSSDARVSGTSTSNGVGSIAGKVTRRGQPIAHALVEAHVDNPAGLRSVEGAADGTFIVENVAAGKVKLVASDPFRGTTVPAVDVTVVAGKQTVANIEDVPAGDVNLTVHLTMRPERGTVIMVQACLFHGAISTQTYADGNGPAIPNDRVAGVAVWMAAQSKAPDLTFQDLAAGDYTVCWLAVSNGPSSTGTVDCVPVTVTPTPTEQSIDDDVPSLTNYRRRGSTK